MWDWHLPTGKFSLLNRFSGGPAYQDRETGLDIHEFFSTVHPDDLPLLGAAIEQHLTDESKPYECDFRVRMPDGRYVWSHNTGRVIEHEASGKPTRMLGIYMDISSSMAAVSGPRTTGIAGQRSGLHCRTSLC